MAEKNKIGYYDLGGNFVDMSSQYSSASPVSSYGSIEDTSKRKKPKQKQQCGKNPGSKCKRNADIRTGMRWQ